MLLGLKVVYNLHKSTIIIIKNSLEDDHLSKYRYVLLELAANFNLIQYSYNRSMLFCKSITEFTKMIISSEYKILETT